MIKPHCHPFSGVHGTRAWSASRSLHADSSRRAITSLPAAGPGVEADRGRQAGTKQADPLLAIADK
jgi:hypothetical protein